MALSANKIKMVRQRWFMPISHFSLKTDGTGSLQSMHTGDALVTEVGTTGIGGMLFNADNEHVVGITMLPTDLDRDNHVYVRVVYSNGDAAGTILFIVTYEAYITGTTAVDGTPATALDTALVADTVAAANVLQKSATAGKINGGTFGDTVDYLAVALEQDTFTTADDATVYGLEFEYSPKFYKGKRDGEAPAWQNEN